MNSQHPCKKHKNSEKKLELVFEIFEDGIYHTSMAGPEELKGKDEEIDLMVIGMVINAMRKNDRVATIINSAMTTFLVRKMEEDDVEHELRTHHTHIDDEEKS